MRQGQAEVKRLQQEIGQLKGLMEERDWTGLQAKVNELGVRASAQGIDSAYLTWCRAIAHRELGETEEAVTAISHAAQLDPVHPAIARTFHEICEHARQRIALEDSSGDCIPALYAQLSQMGETDLSSHLALARYEFARGEVDAAIRLVEAVRVVAPRSLEACELRMHFAQETGDPNAAFYEAMVDDLEVRQPNFGVPGLRADC